MTTTTTPDPEAALRAEIIRLGPWHHDIEIAPGIRTVEVARDGAYPPELGTPEVTRPDVFIGYVVRDVFPDGLAGRSVLDCACNAGGHLFAAAQQGASRGFGFDVREHWIKQARFIARHVPEANVEFAVCDLIEARELRLEPFDVTFFFGILYHLPDPVAGLRIAADLTRELLIVNTAAVPSDGRDALVLNPESQTEVMSGVHRLAWLPTSPRVVIEMLRWCGFPHTRVYFDIPADGHGRRMAIVAAREERMLAHYDSVRPLAPVRRRSWTERLRRRLRR